MKKPDVKYWTCVCGKRHPIIDGQPIRCEDAGHRVYLSPAYWTYDPSEIKKPQQLTLI